MKMERRLGKRETKEESIKLSLIDLLRVIETSKKEMQNKQGGNWFDKGMRNVARALQHNTLA